MMFICSTSNNRHQSFAMPLGEIRLTPLRMISCVCVVSRVAARLTRVEMRQAATNVVHQMINGDRANPLILVLCGLPGAGKSTVSKCIASQAELHGVTVHQFCLDELHLQTNCGFAEPPNYGNEQPALLAGQRHQPADQPKFDPGAWQAARQLLLQQVQQQLTCTKNRQHQQQKHDHQVAAFAEHPQQSQACQQQPTLLVVDDNNHLRSMRYEFVQLARTYDAAFLQIYVMCPVEVCLSRNCQRAGPARLPDEIILRLANNFEAPDPSKSKSQWEAGGRTLTVDSTTQPDPTQLWQSVQQHWGSAPPAPPSEDELLHRRMAGSAANAASLVHQFDMDTRSMLTRALAGVSKESRAAAAQHLNQHRKQLLERLRGRQHVQHQCQPGNQVASGLHIGGADCHNKESGDLVMPPIQCLQQEFLQQFLQLCDSVGAQHSGGS